MLGFAPYANWDHRASSSRQDYAFQDFDSRAAGREGGTRGHETEVVVNFEAAPGGTRLMLVQRRFASKQARDNHTNGWSACFDRLTRVAG